MISKALDIPVGTLHPILKTLKESRLIDTYEDSNTYSVGLGLFLLGCRYINQSKPYEAVNEILQSVVDGCNETSQFGKLNADGNIMYLAKVDSTQSIRMHSAVGKIAPAYSSAIGKALLSEYSFEQLCTLYPDGLVQSTKNTITDLHVLFEELQRVKIEGFSYECGERNEEIRCVAIPLFSNGKIKAALSVDVPVFRYSKEVEDRIKQLLLDARKKLELMIPVLGVE
jgi:DNA-binding IclR family transcriptional regulator